MWQWCCALLLMESRFHLPSLTKQRILFVSICVMECCLFPISTGRMFGSCRSSQCGGWQMIFGHTIWRWKETFHTCCSLTTTVPTRVGQMWIASKPPHFYPPPNVTNMCQPVDMGMIALLKVGCKVSMLNQGLDIFDKPGGFEEAAKLWMRQWKGCKGLDFGGKAHMLDAIQILAQIWGMHHSDSSKHAMVDGIKQCWGKADVLPVEWELEINNDVGNASLVESKKKISDEECLTCVLCCQS